MAAEGRKRKAPPQDPHKLTALRRGSYVSKAGCESVLALVREHGMPTASSRRSQVRARKKVLSAGDNKYGEIIFDVDLPFEDGPVQIALQSPFALLWRLYKDSESFRTLVRETLLRHPCSPHEPWHILMYFDAVSPANPLSKGTDRRDTQCIYFTFLELDRLSDENAWFTPAACRNYLIKKLPGGMSHFFKIVMGIVFWRGARLRS